MKKPVVIIVLAPGFEEVEAITPVDILRRAGAEVVVAGLDKVLVTGAHGIAISCDALLADIMSRTYDAVILPGGLPGAKNLAASSNVRALLDSVQASGGYLSAICASPAYVLGTLGYLAGRKATGYPGTEVMAPGIDFVDQPVVVDGRIVTSRGVGTALDFALTLVELLFSRNAAKELAATVLHS